MLHVWCLFLKPISEDSQQDKTDLEHGKEKVSGPSLLDVSRLVKSQVAGFRAQGTSSVSIASQRLVVEMAEFWMEEEVDHVKNLFEEQPCLYDTRLKI